MPHCTGARLPPARSDRVERSAARRCTDDANEAAAAATAAAAAEEDEEAAIEVVIDGLVDELIQSTFRVEEILTATAAACERFLRRGVEHEVEADRCQRQGEADAEQGILCRKTWLPMLWDS